MGELKDKLPFLVLAFLAHLSSQLLPPFHAADLTGVSPFQPKGADRKQKTDREKMEKRTPHEKEKYQPSYETTILTEVGCWHRCFNETWLALLAGGKELAVLLRNVWPSC